MNMLQIMHLFHHRIMGRKKEKGGKGSVERKEERGEGGGGRGKGVTQCESMRGAIIVFHTNINDKRAK